ncbi:MAG: hypothetical protein HKN25_08265 [Pyrinomonadaceae bacterium]|nr:hypothetical protein [Pyrinomonadaceae bacterium]
MKFNEDQKQALKELGDAINEAVEMSTSVNDAIERLREMGYEPNLNMKLEIALEEIEEARESDSDELDFEFTEDDLRTLKRMKIAVD